MSSSSSERVGFWTGRSTRQKEGRGRTEEVPQRVRERRRGRSEGGSGGSAEDTWYSNHNSSGVSMSLRLAECLLSMESRPCLSSGPPDSGYTGEEWWKNGFGHRISLGVGCTVRVVR